MYKTFSINVKQIYEQIVYLFISSIIFQEKLCMVGTLKKDPPDFMRNTITLLHDTYVIPLRERKSKKQVELTIL